MFNVCLGQLGCVAYHRARCPAGWQPRGTSPAAKPQIRKWLLLRLPFGGRGTGAGGRGGGMGSGAAAKKEPAAGSDSHASRAVRHLISREAVFGFAFPLVIY